MPPDQEGSREVFKIRGALSLLFKGGVWTLVVTWELVIQNLVSPPSLVAILIQSTNSSRGALQVGTLTS